ncbi:hypothetical protein LPJ59_002980 [Coemansia sp. RSA 2399]|nr:hypothetical protein LPJ59_002980 [Coemansia sp. RSA 2399]
MVVAMEMGATASLDAGNVHARREHDGDAGWADDAYAGADARRREHSACATQPPITAQRLKASRIVHLSDALRRKLNSATPVSALGCSVSDIFQLSSRDRGSASHPSARMRSTSSGLWNMLGWLVGGHPQAHEHMRDPCSTASAEFPGISADSSRARWPRRRLEHALVPEDDPLFVGNEGLGAVELASVRAGKHGGVFALCAHVLSTDMQGEWLAWHAAPKQRAASTAAAAAAAADPRLSAVGLCGMQLAIVHVAEVSTLHRVACNGIDSLLPPPLPLDQCFGHMLDSSRSLGPPPMLPPLLKPDSSECDVDADIRWISLLVSRHGLVEMAYPLGRTPIVPADSNDLSLETCPPVAFGSYLGESLFSRIHPEDVVRVVKALRLAWDARPDVYHFSRLRREWQRRRLNSTGDRAVSSAPSTPPLRPHRAATMTAATISASSTGSRHALHPTNRHVYHQEGIEVSNGVVELNVQIQLTGSASVDWSDSDSMSEHTRFARMKLTRWPLILRPPRSNSGYRAGGYNQQQQQQQPEPEEPQDGFVLVGLRPLPEPSRTRSRSTADAYDMMPDLKKLSISSATSVSTLVGFGVGGIHGTTPSHGSAELVRLCRSSSSLSCHETTARPSIEFSDAVVRSGSQRSPPNSNGSSRGRGSGGNMSRGGVDAGWPSSIAIPMARPIVGLSNNAVQTATGISPHLTMRRRSNITVGSQRNNPDEGLASHVYASQCEFTY